MTIIDKINTLCSSGHFKHIEVDEKGYGSFFEFKKSSNRFLEQARSLKREADLLNKQKSNQAMSLYIQSVFRYIKGYKYGDFNTSHWRGLYNYIKELEKMTSDLEIKEFLKSSLFAVKFYLLNLETPEQIESFSKDIKKLYLDFNTLKNVMRLDELEKIYENKFMRR